MTWGKLCDTFCMHPKVVTCGNEAVGAWARMLSYSCGQLSDGFIPAAVALSITRRKVLDALVSARMLHAVEGGFAIHDFAHYNPTRSKVETERAKTAARVAEYRESKAKASGRNGVTDTVTNGVTNAVGNGIGTPAPTRPDPTRPVSPEDTSCLSPPAAATVASASPVSAATGDPFVLTPPAEAPAENTRAKARQRPAKAPPPFSVGDALSAVAAAAGGRFVAGDATTWTKASMIATAGLVRRFPDITEWSLVGEWLAAGGGGAGTKGFAWAASNAFPEAVAKARAWRDDGRPALLDARGFPVRPAPPPERDPTDPWAAADAALDAHFAARRRAGGGL